MSSRACATNSASAIACLRTSVRTTQAARRGSGQRPDNVAIRIWARENGHEISERGRIPAAVVEAYEAAI